jgi:Putative Actinobacterial Holin-X, holin superfamily III
LPGSNGQPDSNLAQVVTEVSERMTVLVREEIELAKAEMSQKLSSLKLGIAGVAIGAVFALLVVPFGLMTLAWFLNDDVYQSEWLGFLTVFGVLVLGTVVAFIFAWRKLRVGPPTPKMALDEAKKIRETVSAKPAELER